MTQIDLLRHGTVDGPAALYGRTDVCISDQGLKQMHKQMQHHPSPDNIISSPLRRCAEFATEYATFHEKELQVYPGLRECDFGEWDGIEFDDTSQHWPLMTSFWQDPISNTPPKGETLSQFNQRVVETWEVITQKYQGQTTLAICHGGVIRQILAHILPVDWQDGDWYAQLNISYASLTRITIPSHENAKPMANFIGIPPSLGRGHFD